jgi:cytidylate kinase
MTGLDTDDQIFIAEANVIKKLAKKESCVIVGRCANFVLKDNKNVTNIFIYSTMEDKIKRAQKYYNIPKKDCEKEINKINKLRKNHYKYYTNTEWNNPNNYDLCINVATLGIEKTVNLIKEYVLEKKN